MKDFFETTNKNFDSVFSSTALRAMETIEIIKPSIKDTEIMYKKDLYTFDDHLMLEFISKINESRTERTSAQGGGQEGKSPMPH